jgi:hypothetical protein
MSVYKVGSSLSIPAGDTTLHFEDFDHYYSTHWETELDLEETIDTVETLFNPSPASDVVVEGSTQLEDTEYREFKKSSSKDLGAEFVSIYTDDYVLTWEETEDSYQLGYRSHNYDPEEAIRLFEKSVGVELSAEDWERASEFLSQNGE